jgi:hypothetical protein
MIPIVEEYNNKTNAEIKKVINGVKQINVNYYPIIAKRVQEDTFFEDFLIKELTTKENLEEKFFGFIKIAWLPLIAIIENSQSELIKKAIAVFNNWPSNEKENFLNYVKNEKEIRKYFE